MKSHGFTLVELLVTIGIIGLISAIGFITYSGVLKQGRDGKRQADLKALQSALEQYHADLGYYPSTLPLDTSISFTSNQGSVSPPPSPQKIYLNQTPTEPLRDPPYCYRGSKSIGLGSIYACDNATSDKCVYYELYTRLENPPRGAVEFTTPAGTPPCIGNYNLQLPPP